LGVTPVLAGKRDTSAHAATQPPQKITKTSTKPSVLERPNINLLLGPMAANSDRFFALNQHFVLVEQMGQLAKLPHDPHNLYIA
jgi:hypothetical protein